MPHYFSLDTEYLFAVNGDLKMKKINKTINPASKEIVEEYMLTSKIVLEDINKIISILKASDIKIKNLAISNSEEQPEHIFETFKTIEEFNKFNWNENIFVDKFGVRCTSKNSEFGLNFNLYDQKVISTRDENINLEPLLIYIEESCKKG